MKDTWNTAGAESKIRENTIKRLMIVGQFLEDQVGINIRRQGLVDSADLLNSRYHALSGSDTVQIGVNVPYAAIHEFGGEIKQTVTEKQKRFFFARAYGEQKNHNRAQRKAKKG
jgi:phage gpG-like protein